MKRWTPHQKQLHRRSDKRGCGGTYRGERRNEAKRLGYVWAALRRTRNTNGMIVVLL